MKPQELARRLTHSFSEKPSRIRLIRLVYLSDWKSAIEHKEQITSAKYVIVSGGLQFYGMEDICNCDCSCQQIPELTSNQINVIDHVVRTTHDKSWSELERLVNSTFPMRTQRRFQLLDLVAMADEYAEEKRMLKGE